MKKILILLLCFVAATLSYADPISEQEAYQIAQQFMQGKLKTVSKTSAKLKAKRVAAAQKNLYIFNAESNGGFVIVSGDDRTPSILGYSDRGEIDTEKIPCNVKWLLDSYDSAIASLDDSGSTAAAATASATRTAIEPLLDTQWGQGSPYNSLCPTIDSEQCVTGCVATAMAQIVNYNRWPQGETATVAAYTTSTKSISMSALPATTFDWNNMGSTAIARLMLYCGQSVSMDYGTGGSGAAVADVATALTDVFGYSKSASYKAHSDFTDDEWSDMIYAELSESRPVLFGGQSSTGGHAFVVDGCDSEGQFHINWGWSGYCDGYFTLDGLNPTSNDGYNSSQEIVCSIAPPADASDITRPKAIVTKMTTSSSYLERANASADFAALTVGSTLQSDMSETATLQIGLALYDDNGLVKVLSSGNHEFTTTESYTYEASVTIGSDIPQGEYRLVAVNRSGDSDEWLADAGSSDNYISVTVGDTGLTLTIISKSGDSSTIDFGVHTIDGVTYSLKYEGSGYHAKVELLNGTDKYSGDVYIPDYVNYQNITFRVYISATDVFCDSPELTSLSLGSCCTTIDCLNLNISNCKKLEVLTIREGATYIGYITGCPLLTSLSFPSSLYSVERIASNKNLKSITFGFSDFNSFEIGGGWYGSVWSAILLPSLTDIYFYGMYPPATSSDQSNYEPNENITIHIPKGMLEVYKKSEWKNYNLVDDLPALDEDSFIRLDYCGDEINVPTAWLLGCGENEMEFAMHFPTEDIEAYEGAQIKTLEFKMMSSFYQQPDYVFITTEGKDYIVKQYVNNLNVGSWNQITLDQPYTITGEELYIGFGRKGGLGASFANEDVVDDGYYLRVMGNDGWGYEHNTWIKHGDDNTRVYPLFIRAIVESSSYPTDVVIAAAKVVDTDTAQSSGYINKQVRVKLKNRSPRVVKQITLGWDIDGKKQGQQTFDTYLFTNYETIVYVDIPKVTVGRNHTMEINVVSIDGEEDAIPSNSEISVIYSVPPSKYYPRKTVMENLTSNDESFVREWITTKKMEENYPDNFITVSVHYRDNMTPTSNEYYNELVELTSNIRAAYNRTRVGTPWPFSLEDTKDNGVAQVKVNATFDEAEYKVNVDTDTAFGFSDDGSTEYRLAYVLVEDSVGPYIQYNSFANREDLYDNEYWGWWAHQGETVEMLYDNVAREIYDDFYGVEGQLPSVITEGETYKSEYSLAIPDNVQNAKNLKVVALLLDMSTGEILNADRTAISGEVLSGIGTINNGNSTTSDVYNLMGMKVRVGASSLNGLPQGVYIVNGKKIAIR